MAEPQPSDPALVLARELQSIKTRLNRLERPSGSQNNRNKDKVQAALDALQEQVDYLGGLTTTVVRATDDLYNTTPGGQITDPSTAPAYTFTLAEPMRVRIEISAQAKLSASGVGGTPSIEAVAIARMFLNGALVDAQEASSRARTAITASDSANYATGGDSLLLERLVTTLPAGTHTVASQWRSQGIGASCSIFIENRTLTVEILGRP